MKQIKAEIIAVGTELLLGQIANTNAQWLSQKLAEYGINVYNHAVVGDNLMRVKQVFELAQERSDIVLVTGGLGPTEDDMTREAFQAVSGLEMMEDEFSMEKIEAFFKRQNRTMTPNNRKQARVFEGAEVLENTVGMAPGMHVNHKGVEWFFMPGVPKEMKAIFAENAIPVMEAITGKQQVIGSTVMRFIGIGESSLEHELQELIQKQSNPTIAPLAQEDGVVIRLTANGSDPSEIREKLAEAKQRVIELVGDYYYGDDEMEIEEAIVSMLKQSEQTIAAAESLTGGKFMERLVGVSGASQVTPGGIVAYDTAIKQDILGVDPATIEEHGTVSEACALEMARRACEKFKTDLGISFTGVAGPEPMEGKEVGTVYIALVTRDGQEKVEKLYLSHTRQAIRNRAVLKGFEIIFDYLK